MCPIFLNHIRIVASQDLGLGHISVGGTCARGCGNNISILIDKLKVVSAEKVWNGRQLRSVSSGVVVEFE